MKLEISAGAVQTDANYGAYVAILFHRASDVYVITYTALVIGGWVLAARPIQLGRFGGQTRRPRHPAKKRRDAMGTGLHPPVPIFALLLWRPFCARLRPLLCSAP